ncbi:MAG: ABC transporter substrate-binding protein [Conexibacter sp.]
MPNTKRRAGALLAACLSLLALLLAGCGGGNDNSSSSTKPAAAAFDPSKPASLTVWSWAPQTEPAAKAYMKLHPAIKIKVVNAGIETAEYAKIRAGIEAGRGAPDVALMSFPNVQEFAITHDLLDLSRYGAAQMTNDIAPWCIDLLSSQDGGLYGLPTDAGVMGFLYREDLLRKAGVTPPKTWAEFATAAVKLHKALPSSYLTNFPLGQFPWLQAMMWQAGSKPVQVDGTTLTLKMNDAPALRVAAYWDDLLRKGVVDPAPAFTTPYYAAIDRGDYAGWVAPQWGPVLIRDTSPTWGKWRAARLPQWSTSAQSEPLWSSSAYVATAQSKAPGAAADFIKFITHDKQIVHSLSAQTPYAFYPLKSLYQSKAWLDQKLPFYGPQKANRVFAQAAEHVDGSYESTPFEDYVVTQGNQLVGDAIKSHGSLVNALNELQDRVVKYAKQQGFTVKS